MGLYYLHLFLLNIIHIIEGLTFLTGKLTKPYNYNLFILLCDLNG